MRTPNVQRMQETLNYIKDQHKKTGRIPSFRTIKAEQGYKSMNTLSHDIERLKDAGALIVDKEGRIHLPMSMKERKQTATVVGGIRCGTPTEATEEMPETVELPVALFGEDLNRVVMKAEGDSMVGLGIHDGDWLIVKKQPVARAGQIVAAMFAGGDFTCKTLRKDEEGFYLEAANADFGDIRPDEDWFIYGVVQQVIHKV